MMRSEFFVIVCLPALPLWAQLQPPSLGHFLDPHGHPHPVLGVPGAFVLGEEGQIRLLNLACSASFCVSKTETQVLAKGFAADVPGPALIAVEGDRALLYFLQTGQFSLLEDGRLTQLAWTFPGEVAAIGLERIAIRDGSHVRILRTDGAVLRTVDTNGPVELLPDGVAHTAPGELVISRDSGEETRYAMDDVKSFFRPSAEYLGVRTQSATFLIRLARGHEDLWQLPEAAE